LVSLLAKTRDRCWQHSEETEVKEWM